MATFNLNKSVLVTTNDDTDGKYRVADDAARDLLITQDRIKVGHTIYHEADGKKYMLKTYPTFGSLIGVVWEEDGGGAGLTSQQESDLENITSHISDTNIHVSTTEKNTWNNKVDSEVGKSLSTNDYTDIEKAKLSNIEENANYITSNSQLTNGEGYITSFTNTQRSDEEIRDVASSQWVNGTNTTVVKNDNANTIKINATDTNTQLTDSEVRSKFTPGANVSISTEGVISATDTTYTVGDNGLTEKNFTNSLKTKLDNLNINAEENVNSDWNATSGDAEILNKPNIPTSLVDLGYTGETNATADQTSSEIIELYESDSDINRYSNFQKNKNGLYLTDFECKPDLKYIDIEFNSSNEIICPLDPFTDADVGKLIAIKNTHHNPNTADGTEYPNSQLGRIVTVTTKITAVNNGVATIDFSCNLTANARAYSYTNNFDALQDAINYAQENKIETIVRDSEGIYGINPLFSEKYTNAPALVIPNTWHLTIKGMDENPFKFCVEDTTVARDFIQIKQGNYDFTLDGKILPSDRFTTTFNLFCVLVNTNWNNQYAGNSVRTITIKNIVVTEMSDTDGNDSFFNAILTNSRGGLNNSDKKQIFKIENVNVRLIIAGLSSFSQLGNYNTHYVNNVDLTRWSNHYIGENGRDLLQTGGESEGLMESWKFDISFTVLNGVLTIDNTNDDFSFYDHRNDYILGAGRTIYVEINSIRYEITDVNNAKSVNVTGLTDGNYTGEWIITSGYGSLGHPAYYHPNQDIYFENVISTKDELKISSSGGVPNLTNNIVSLINCETSRLYFEGANYKPNIYIENSKVNSLVLNQSNKLTIKNSETNFVGSLNYIESFGGNNFKETGNLLSSGVTIKESNDIVFYNDIIDFSYLDFEKESHVVFDNWSISEEGIGRVGFYDENSTVIYKNSKRKTAFSFESIGRHSNFYAYYINNKITEPLYRTSTKFSYTFHPTVLTDKVFFINNIISFNNNRYNLDPNQSIYLEQIPTNKIGVSEIYKLKGKYDSILAIQYRYQNTSFGFNRDTWNIDLGLDFNKSNYFKLVDQTDQRWIPRGLAVVPLNSSNSIFSRGVGLGCLSHNSLFEGHIYIEITNSNQLNVLESKLNYYDGRNVTNNNILVNTLERKVGEVLKFELLPNGFLKQVSSTNEEKTYVPTIPTRKGIQGEKLWLNSNVSYQYDINTNLLIDEVLTVSLVEGIPFEHNGFTEAYTIDTGKVFTIGQNFSDGNITPFSFRIVLDDNTELSFDNVGLYNNPNSTVDELPNLVRSAWLYKANNGVSTYCAYVDNLSGKIVILKNNDITLKATNNLIINGLEVVSENWYRNYEKQGVELLTTIERNAILSECREGYEVFDTDLNQRFIKANNVWI